MSSGPSDLAFVVSQLRDDAPKARRQRMRRLRLGIRSSAMRKRGETAMHVAARCGAAHKVAALLRDGGDVAQKDNIGRLALHHAAAMGSVNVCEMLIHAGSPVNATDTQGNTPAAIAGHAASLRTLLRHGATPPVSAPWWARKLVRRWAAGEGHEQVAARAVRKAANRRMLPELAAICAAYLVVPAPRDAGDRSVVDGSEANWDEDWDDVD